MTCPTSHCTSVTTQGPDRSQVSRNSKLPHVRPVPGGSGHRWRLRKTKLHRIWVRCHSPSPSKRGQPRPKKGRGRREAASVSPQRGGRAASLPHRLPSCTSFQFLPPRPLRLQPRARRTTVQNDSFTHKDSHQQRHVPQQPFPGEGWVSGVPAAVPSLGRPLASGRPATTAQAHKGRCRDERALPPGRARASLGARACGDPDCPGRAALSPVRTRHVPEAESLCNTGLP